MPTSWLQLVPLGGTRAVASIHQSSYLFIPVIEIVKKGRVSTTILLTRNIIYSTAACAGTTSVCAAAKLGLLPGNETPYFYAFILRLMQRE